MYILIDLVSLIIPIYEEISFFWFNLNQNLYINRGTL